MTDLHPFQSKHSPELKYSKFAVNNLEVDYLEKPDAKVSPFQPIDSTPSQLATCEPPECVSLDLEKLDCYEIVDKQFQTLGVTFKNAIALQPSNPAFPARSGKMVLMGAPRNGWLEATFCRPVRFVRGFVTSSRGTVLAAFDSNNKPIAQAKSTASNLTNSKSGLSPNVELSLSGKDIHRITFYTFDGHLTLNDFSFGA
jgi:hypothetical protein